MKFSFKRFPNYLNSGCSLTLEYKILPQMQRKLDTQDEKLTLLYITTFFNPCTLKLSVLCHVTIDIGNNNYRPRSWTNAIREKQIVHSSGLEFEPRSGAPQHAPLKYFCILGALKQHFQCLLGYNYTETCCILCEGCIC